jgi:hypothetical protein
MTAEAMTGMSTARARASRRNARKSTGPKTPAGKTTSARNARRHGLSPPGAALIHHPFARHHMGASCGDWCHHPSEGQR